ncbi:MAG TPA: hypothetical protein VGH77_16960 [Streptosporangiaceae bacterium]|jgi:hypothetical protein
MRAICRHGMNGGGEQFLRECLDGLADFWQSDPDGVEYQAVGQVAALQVSGSHRSPP